MRGRGKAERQATQSSPTSTSTFYANTPADLNPVISGEFTTFAWGPVSSGVNASATTISHSPYVVAYTSSTGVESMLNQETTSAPSPAAGQWGRCASGQSTNGCGSPAANTLHINAGEDASLGVAHVSDYAVSWARFEDQHAARHYLLEVDSPSAGGSNIATAYMNGVDVVFDHLLVKFSPQYSVNVGPICTSGCQVSNSTIYNDITGNYTGDSAGIYSAGTGVLIQGNTVHDIRGSAAPSGDGIDLNTAVNNSVTGNTLYNNGKGVYPTGWGAGILVTGTSHGNLISQNWSHNNYGGFLEVNASTNYPYGNTYFYNLAASNTVNDFDNQGDSSSLAASTYYNNSVYHNPSANNTPAYGGHAYACQNNCNKIILANNIRYNASPATQYSQCFGFNYTAGMSIEMDYNIVYGKRFLYRCDSWLSLLRWILQHLDRRIRERGSSTPFKPSRILKTCRATRERP